MKLIGKLKDNVANAETKEAVKQLIEDAALLSIADATASPHSSALPQGILN